LIGREGLCPQCLKQFTGLVEVVPGRHDVAWSAQQQRQCALLAHWKVRAQASELVWLSGAGPVGWPCDPCLAEGVVQQRPESSSEAIHCARHGKRAEQRVALVSDRLRKARGESDRSLRHKLAHSAA